MWLLPSCLRKCAENLVTLGDGITSLWEPPTMSCPPRVRRLSDFCSALACVLALALLQTLHASGPRVLPEGETPKDVRLGELKDLNGYFPFQPPASLDEWNKRAEEVRRRILV